MPKAYIVASINVTDPVGYEVYVSGAVRVTHAAGGRLLVSGGRTEAIEGALHNRILVIEFERLCQRKTSLSRQWRPISVDG